MVRIVAPAQKRASLRWLIVHETELLILGVCVAASLVAGDPPSVRERRGTSSLALSAGEYVRVQLHSLVTQKRSSNRHAGSGGPASLRVLTRVELRASAAHDADNEEGPSASRRSPRAGRLGAWPTLVSSMRASPATERKAIDFGGTDAARVVLVQPNGRIVVAGGGAAAVSFCVAGLRTNGAPDTTFGSGGKRVIDFGGDVESVEGAALQLDGKIVLAGGSDVRVAVARLNPNGSLDIGFSGDGIEEVVEAPDGETLVSVQRTQGRMRHTEMKTNVQWATKWTIRDGKVLRAYGYLTRAEALEAAGLSE